jgi:Alginate lyase
MIKLVPLLVAVSPLLGGCNWVFGIEQGDPGSEPAPGPIARSAVYASVDDLTATKAAVDAAREPWASAYAPFMSDVAEAEALSPVSVIDDGPGADQSDARVFATDALQTDCIVGLTNGRHDYCAALLMGKAARDLAIAWVMTGQASYAERAIDHIHHFLLDDTTGVRPTANNGGPLTSGESSGSTIELALYVPLFAYAASVLHEHPHWATLATADAEDAFTLWLTTWRSDALSNAPAASTGSRYVYHLNALASVEAYLDDPALNTTFAAWRVYVNDIVASDGSLDGAGDSAMFWLKGLTLTAAIARQHEGALFDHDGRLASSLDAYAPCLSGDAACPMATPLDTGSLSEGGSTFELAHGHFDSAAQLAAIEAVGRPLEDLRVLGWVTLTHGNAFER